MEERVFLSFNYYFIIIIISLLKAASTVMVIYYFSQPMLGILLARYWELKQNDQISSHLQETFGKESGKKKDWEGELSACHADLIKSLPV